MMTDQLSDHEYLTLHGIEENDVVLECFDLREQVKDLTAENARLAAAVKALQSRPADNDAHKRTTAALMMQLERERAVLRASHARNQILVEKLRALGA